MRTKRLGMVLLAVLLASLLGCAAVGVTSSDDPSKKLVDAGHLIDQGRSLPAERLIHEAIEIYRERDDPHGLGYAFGLYAELLQSNAVNKAELSFMRDGFRDKTVTLSNRFEKSTAYTRAAMVQSAPRSVVDLLRPLGRAGRRGHPAGSAGGAGAVVFAWVFCVRGAWGR